MKPTCSVEGCGKPRKTRGLCRGHYWQLQQGNGLRPIRAESPELRFWDYVNKNGPVSEALPELGQCWIWTRGKFKQGYGAFKTGGKTFKAHRFAYHLAHGELPPSVGIDHRCHNHLCVRPSHLREVSPKQNAEHRVGANKNNSTGYRGVSRVKRTGKYVARVRHNYRLYSVSGFDSPERAAAAAALMRLELFTHNDIDQRALRGKVFSEANDV